jgi:type IV pilus assembly protein PilV
MSSHLPLNRSVPRSNSLSKQKGILLIEVLLSILIFSFGILGLVGLQAVSIQNSANAEARNTASALANDIVSQMWVRQTSATSDAGLSADIASWKDRVNKSTLPNASGDVSVNNNLATITITWKAPSKKSTDNSNRYVTQVMIPAR